MDKNKKILIVITAIFVIIGAISFETSGLKDTIFSYFGSNTPEIQVQYEVNSKADFYTYQNNIFYMTKDGIQLLDSRANVSWSDTFNMSSPILLHDAGIVAVCEKDGKVLKIYDTKGVINTINTTEPIISASINNKGYSCVITKGESYSLSVYSTSNDKIFDGSFVMDDGIPICSDISDDGSILAVSFLQTNDIKLKSNVCFYYINGNNIDISQESDSDYMFASFNEEDSFIGMLSFMENNNLVAVSDNSIINVTIDTAGTEKYKEVFRYSLKNKISNINFDDKKLIVVAFGDAKLNEEKAEKPNNIKWFNLKGNVVSEYQANKTITGISSGFNSILVQMDKQLVAVNNRGVDIWEYDAMLNINDAMFYSSKDSILIVTDTAAFVTKPNNDDEDNNEIEKEIESQETQNQDESTTTQVTTQAPKQDTKTETTTIATTVTTTATTTKVNKTEAKTETTTAEPTKTNKTTKTETTTKKQNTKTETTTQVTTKAQTNTTNNQTVKENVTEATTQKVTAKTDNKSQDKQETVTQKTDETNNQNAPVMPE